MTKRRSDAPYTEEQVERVRAYHARSGVERRLLATLDEARREQARAAAMWAPAVARLRRERDEAHSTAWTLGDLLDEARRERDAAVGLLREARESIDFDAGCEGAGGPSADLLRRIDALLAGVEGEGVDSQVETPASQTEGATLVRPEPGSAAYPSPDSPAKSAPSSPAPGWADTFVREYRRGREDAAEAAMKEDPE